MSHKVDLFGNQGSHLQVCQWPGKTHLKHWELYFPFDSFCKMPCPDELHPKLWKTAFKPRFRAGSAAVCSVLWGACGTLLQGRDPALALLIPTLWGRGGSQAARPMEHPRLYVVTVTAPRKTTSCHHFGGCNFARSQHDTKE